VGQYSIGANNRGDGAREGISTRDLSISRVGNMNKRRFMEAHMPARKSSFTKPVATDSQNAARQAPPEAALLRGHKTAHKGDSETRFTRAELEQLLSSRFTSPTAVRAP